MVGYAVIVERSSSSWLGLGVGIHLTPTMMKVVRDVVVVIVWSPSPCGCHLRQSGLARPWAFTSGAFTRAQQ